MHHHHPILSPLVGAVGFVFGPVWMAAARRSARSGSVADTERMRDRLAPYFDADLIDRVEIRVVERIKGPGMRMAPAGLCLGRVVVMARAEAESGRFESVLFHEMVHSAQMRRTGTARFCAAYLGGWWLAGRSYIRIPLEIEAFRLQARFDAGERFSVGEELDKERWSLRRLAAVVRLDGPFPTKPPPG